MSGNASSRMDRLGAPSFNLDPAVDRFHLAMEADHPRSQTGI
jgi:hypothetical protein